MYNTLTSQRILSIDAFRGITILIMIFVNEIAGVSGVPAWMKHVPADADAMTFVDVVFPAFLFIVGMSIPFALNKRLAKGEGTLRLQKHVLFRTLGLLTLGVFMVNAEGGYHQESMIIPIHLWSLLFYVAIILVWNVYHFERKTPAYVLRGIGLILLIALAFIYRGGEDGSEPLQPQWWGILGLIGWAYLIACILYQLSDGNLVALLAAIVLCLAFYVVGKLKAATTFWMADQGGHAVHTMIALCGVVLSLIFFDLSKPKSKERRFIESISFAGVLIITGFVLRPYYTVSKIHATPSWGLYSAAICCIIFMILYWIIDIRRFGSWTSFFRPAAANPLLTYIIPFIVYALLKVLGIWFPDFLYQGTMGILWAAVYAVAVMGIVILLNKLNIRLQL